MLDKYLETDVQNKLYILSILHLRQTVTLKELTRALNLSASTVYATIHVLNYEFQGVAAIENHNAVFHLILPAEDTFMQLSHKLYAHSLVLHCLKFFLTNTHAESFSKFMEQHSLTRSSAYRIRKKCADYLENIGLHLQKNSVTGEEYRIRFLIALLSYKYGFHCYEIDEASIHLVRRFILSTNQQIDGHFLEHSAYEYGFSEILFILTWKRHDREVYFQAPKSFDQLKQMFAYLPLKQSFQSVVEPALGITFSESELNYVYLVYLSTNNCLFSDKWTPKHIRQLHRITETLPKFCCLQDHFGRYFGEKVANSGELRSILIYFYKKCILNLQCIIPDKHYYFQDQDDFFRSAVKELVIRVLNAWKADGYLSYPVDERHISYLSSQLTTVCRQFAPPIHVYILSDLTAELKIMNLYLTKRYSGCRIEVHHVLINAEDLSFLSQIENSVVILAKKTFEHARSLLAVPQCNRILTTNVDINSGDRKDILDAIIWCETNQLQGYLNER